MFAYCKNNPVNMKDPAGYRPILCGPGEEETPAMQTASARIMLESAKKRSYSSSTNYWRKAVSAASAVAGSADGIKASTIADATIADRVTGSWRAKIWYPRSFSKALKVGYGANYAAVKALKFAGPIGTIALGIGIVDNMVNYQHGWARTGVDIRGYAAVGLVSFGMSCAGAPVAGAVAVGFVAGLLVAGACGWFKDTFLGAKK